MAENPADDIAGAAGDGPPRPAPQTVEHAVAMLAGSWRKGDA